MTYAIFMRRPVVFAPRLALRWLEDTGRERNTKVEVDQRYIEGKWVGAGEPMMYITGSFFHLVDLETIFLQKLGPACVAAYNAWTMCADMPKSAFLAMDARHCAGQEMAEMMAYAASVGSNRAKRKVGAVGFIGRGTASRAKPGAVRHGIAKALTYFEPDLRPALKKEGFLTREAAASWSARNTATAKRARASSSRSADRGLSGSVDAGQGGLAALFCVCEARKSSGLGLEPTSRFSPERPSTRIGD